ncbi:MAG: permease prefix domain 1-containing protein [Lachnospiraceae bacterium]|nr:permease prefix domain 1-containing protein [Lachnospiraceae bacterium]
METIRNYLEAMFANLPNTAEVKKAKSELLAMMEDKYNELISEGESENSAVGTVISEFGNLDELAEDLGLAEEVKETHERESEQPRRFVNMDQVTDFLDSRKKSGLLVGIGVMLCIISVFFPAFIDNIGLFKSDAYGVAGMFICIALGVALFVFNGITGSDWDFLKKEACQIDMSTAHMVREKRNTFKLTYAFMITIGVVLCAFCWLPLALIDADILSSFIFPCVGIGVFLFIYGNSIMGSYETVLKLNDSRTISGNYGKENDVQYINETATAVMEVYWTTVTCLYLMISFISVAWEATWVIWPVAAILHKILKLSLSKED